MKTPATAPTIYDFIRSHCLSLDKEAAAYESLWAESGATYKTIHEKFKHNDKLPSDILEKQLFDDSDKITAVIQEKQPNAMFRHRPQFNNVFSKMRHPLAFFYYRGDINLTLDEKLISVVGTRKPSDKGVKNARYITKLLVDEGYTIVSGLAEGIDTIALETAIAAGGNVIGVIGTPIDKYYPRTNKSLQDTIRDSHVLISHVPFYRYELEPFASKKYHFQERNGIMAALARGTIIVEASETSGTYSQARECSYMNKSLCIFKRSAGIHWIKNYIAEGKASVIDSLSNTKNILSLLH